MCLQLAGFFIFASTVVWIDKVSSGAIRRAAKHLPLYQAAVVVTAIVRYHVSIAMSGTDYYLSAQLEIPWLVLVSLGWFCTAVLSKVILQGWISVRREKRQLFAAFLIIGLVLMVVSSTMFASALYRFVFISWSLFATITASSSNHLVFTQLTWVFRCLLTYSSF